MLVVSHQIMSRLHSLVVQFSTFALLFSASCSRGPSIPSTSQLLAGWQDPGTVLGARLGCAKLLLKKNVSAQEAEALLGLPSRRHENFLEFPGGTPRLRYDYDFADGTIVVLFQQVTNAGQLETKYTWAGIWLKDADRRDPGTNSQGGANGRQPARSETNPASAAAASRRSP
jgi:hypothetical protein